MDKILNASNFLSWSPFYPCTSHLTTRVVIFNNHTLGKIMVVVPSFFFKPRTHESFENERII